MEKIEDEVLACFYETLPNCENPSRNPFKMLIAAFRKPPVILYIFP
jgi:hypothetical protein